MEQRPTNEQQPDERAVLALDLAGPDGNVFNVITLAQQQLDGEPRQQYNKAIWAAMEQGSGKRYMDILAIVNTYVDLVDTSNTYAEYTRERHIMRAAESLQEQIDKLPESVACQVEGLYPEITAEGMGPAMYLTLLEMEAARINWQLTEADDSEREGLEQLKEALEGCMQTLRRMGV